MLYTATKLHSITFVFLYTYVNMLLCAFLADLNVLVCFLFLHHWLLWSSLFGYIWMNIRKIGWVKLVGCFYAFVHRMAWWFPPFPSLAISSYCLILWSRSFDFVILTVYLISINWYVENIPVGIVSFLRSLGECFRG